MADFSGRDLRPPAAASIVTGPMLFLAGTLLRFMVSGLTAGATKG